MRSSNASFSILSIALLLVTASSAIAAASSTAWTTSPVLVDWNNNLFPSALQLSNGSVWVAYQKSSTASGDDIYLIVHNGFGWSGQIPLALGPAHDITPSLVELRNHTVLTVWPRKTGTDYDLYAMRYARGRWSPPALLVQGSGDDFNPALLAADDGRTWLVWSRSTQANGGGDLYYRIYDGLFWSQEQLLVGGLSEDKFPAISQTKDHRIWILWESNSDGNARIRYRILNGASWSDTFALTATSSDDKWPALAQDRNGVIWALWARELRTQDPVRPFQWDIYYKSSTANGASWSADALLFSEDATDDWHPSVAQGNDRSIWLVWNSDRPTPYGTHNIYLAKTGPVITHNLSVSLAIEQEKPRSGEIFTIRVQTDNLGDFKETFTLTLMVDGFVGSSTEAVLEAGQSTVHTFAWPTIGKPLGAHTFQASVGPVPGENIPWDNTKQAKFHTVPGGDVERNGIVNVSDLSLMAASFGSNKGQSTYNPLADLNSNGQVEVFDLIMAGGTFAQKTTLPPDFYLMASQYHVQLAPGSSVDLSITVGQVSGLSTPVLLSVSAVGSDVAFTFLTNLPNPPGAAILRLEAPADSSPATFSMTVTGTNGPVERSIDITLIIA